MSDRIKGPGGQEPKMSVADLVQSLDVMFKRLKVSMSAYAAAMKAAKVAEKSATDPNARDGPVTDIVLTWPTDGLSEWVQTRLGDMQYADVMTVLSLLAKSHKAEMNFLLDKIDEQHQNLKQILTEGG